MTKFGSLAHLESRRFEGDVVLALRLGVLVADRSAMRGEAPTTQRCVGIFCRRAMLLRSQRRVSEGYEYAASSTVAENT